MAQIARGGQVDISLAATQSVVVGSFGAGQAKIYTAPVIVGEALPLYVLLAVVTGGSTYLTFASATNVRIEASTACEVEYDFGAQPALTTHPLAVATGLTARAGGGQALATPLTGNINRVTVCATANDSVLLPPATVGRRLSVFNGGAALLVIFPQPGQSINNLGTNVSTSIGAVNSALFECVAPGQWNSFRGS